MDVTNVWAWQLQLANGKPRAFTPTLLYSVNLRVFNCSGRKRVDRKCRRQLMVATSLQDVRKENSGVEALGRKLAEEVDAHIQRLVWFSLLLLWKRFSSRYWGPGT